MKKVIRFSLTAIGVALGAIIVASCDSKTQVKPAYQKEDSEYECKDGKCYPKPKKTENQLGK